MAASSMDGDDYDLYKPPPLEDVDSPDSSAKDMPYTMSADIDDDLEFGTFGEVIPSTLDRSPSPHVVSNPAVVCEPQAAVQAENTDQSICTAGTADHVDSMALPPNAITAVSDQMVISDAELDERSVDAGASDSPTQLKHEAVAVADSVPLPPDAITAVSDQMVISDAELDERSVDAGASDSPTQLKHEVVVVSAAAAAADAAVEEVWQADFAAFPQDFNTLTAEQDTVGAGDLYSQPESSIPELPMQTQQPNSGTLDDKQIEAEFTGETQQPVQQPTTAAIPDAETEPEHIQKLAAEKAADLDEVESHEENATDEIANVAETADDDFGDFGDFGEFEDAPQSVPIAVETEQQQQIAPVSVAINEQSVDKADFETPSNLDSTTGETQAQNAPSQASYKSLGTVEERLRAVCERCFPDSPLKSDEDRQASVFDTEFAASQRSVWRSTLVVESSAATSFTWQQSNFNLLLLRALRVDTRNVLISSKNMRVVPAYAKGLGMALQPSNSVADEPNLSQTPLSPQKPASVALTADSTRTTLEPVAIRASMTNSHSLELDASSLEHLGSRTNATATKKLDISIDEFLEIDSGSTKPSNKSSAGTDTKTGVAFPSSEEEILEKIRRMKAGSSIGPVTASTSGPDASRDPTNTHNNGEQDDVQAQARREAERIASRLPDLSFVRSVKLLNQ